MFNKLLKTTTLSALVLGSFAFTAMAETFTVETLNNLNQLRNVKVSPQGDILVYGLKKGTSAKDNHLYLQEIKSGKVRQLTSHEKSESNVVFAADDKKYKLLPSAAKTTLLSDFS